MEFLYSSYYTAGGGDIWYMVGFLAPYYLYIYLIHLVGASFELKDTAVIFTVSVSYILFIT